MHVELRTFLVLRERGLPLSFHNPRKGMIVHGAQVIVLSLGWQRALQVCETTVDILEAKSIEVTSGKWMTRPGSTTA